MPTSLPRPCVICKELHHSPSSRCDGCREDAQRPRESPSARGYDATYQRNRKTLLAQPGAACAACGTTNQLTADHIIPVSRGGSGELYNLQVLCLKHNASKGNRAAPRARPEDSLGPA